MSDQAILRITREIKQIQQGADLSLAVYYDDSDIRSVRALILGPPDTPYQFGFFEFLIKFGKEYPATSPNVRALTTNGGRSRFNPNIYSSGRVCLSILGTWRGESGEQWSSAQCLESLLISIQSLMSANPYENEPGYESSRSPSDIENMEAYVSKIHHETLRLAVLEPLEASLNITLKGSTDSLADPTSESDDNIIYEDGRPSFDPFADFRKRRFLWYYEPYMQSLVAAEKKHSRKAKFQRMPFEGGNNIMDGHFDYPELKRRMAVVRDAILRETCGWAVEGQLAKKQEWGIAASLQRQYEQIVETLKHQNNITVDLYLDEGNPFMWRLTYFGRPMTQLDGGMFKILIHLSPRFPEEQPRVFLEASSFFHIRVSKEGVLCYVPRRTEEMRYHIEGIVASLEEEHPPYDPRTTVNPEATKLFWGTPEDRRKYNRELRRSVERTAET
ncbi:ubiquitin-conjugating enzyme [Aspergillus eucalypticola CBS 122712]|uniref:Ubiquitin-conjugating enzyme E2 Z n=1 Tax=Aspergillus eucalypticola (strain CBS 122712 / IBT 29274) TaxID=1448314 RepID=A0A317VYJ0_ASPEC|nr:ubiquitin-conjugating enzyme [Aspergillus eucalypticola CBS 122712]PWY78845.1 ubiquitin-conjugating enzyme [Aspergillus eucalypticola CBS 122712]